MPHMGRDEQTDASRTGRPYERGEAMYDTDTGAKSIADEKRMFPDTMNATRGASDIGKIVPGK